MDRKIIIIKKKGLTAARLLSASLVWLLPEGRVSGTWLRSERRDERCAPMRVWEKRHQRGEEKNTSERERDRERAGKMERMEGKLSFPLGSPTPSPSHLSFTALKHNKKWLTVVCLHCLLFSCCSLRQTTLFHSPRTLVSLLSLSVYLSIPRSTASVDVIWHHWCLEQRALERTKERTDECQ